LINRLIISAYKYDRSCRTVSKDARSYTSSDKSREQNGDSAGRVIAVLCHLHACRQHYPRQGRGECPDVCETSDVLIQNIIMLEKCIVSAIKSNIIITLEYYECYGKGSVILFELGMSVVKHMRTNVWHYSEHRNPIFTDQSIYDL